jgi:hypothetical protein
MTRQKGRLRRRVPAEASGSGYVVVSVAAGAVGAVAGVVVAVGVVVVAGAGVWVAASDWPEAFVDAVVSGWVVGPVGAGDAGADAGDAGAGAGVGAGGADCAGAVPPDPNVEPASGTRVEVTAFVDEGGVTGVEVVGAAAVETVGAGVAGVVGVDVVGVVVAAGAVGAVGAPLV